MFKDFGVNISAVDCCRNLVGKLFDIINFLVVKFALHTFGDDTAKKFALANQREHAGFLISRQNTFRIRCENTNQSVNFLIVTSTGPNKRKIFFLFFAQENINQVV